MVTRVLNQQASVGVDTVLADEFTEYSENPKCFVIYLQPHFGLAVVGSQRDGIPVSVLDNSVILPDGSQNVGAHALVGSDQRPQMLSFFPECFCWNFLGGTVDSGIARSFQPFQTAVVQNLVV